MTTVTTATTDDIIALALNSQGRNRAANMEVLKSQLDPAGTHVLNMSMVHNDVELRTWWLVKASNTMEPVDLWLDVDFEVFQKHTKTEDHGGLD